jgi:hypothetical protein
LWNFPSQSSIKVCGQAQQTEDLLLNGGERRDVSESLMGQVHLGQGHRHKGLQEPLGGRSRRGSARIILIESSQARPLVFQGATHHKLHESQYP